MLQKTVIAKTGTDKGLLITQLHELRDWLKPDCRYLLTLQEFEPGTSQRLKGYYYNKIVPDFQKGLYDQGTIKTKEETDMYMRSISPITNNQQWNGRKWINQIRGISELNTYELQMFIFEIHLFAAENLNIYIDDPRTI